MITQMTSASAPSRLPRRAASTAFAALLLLGLPLAAQSRGHAGGSGGGGRSAHSTGGGSHSSASGGAPHYSPGSSGSGGSNSGGSGSGGRTAHEVPGGSSAHRQPHGGGRGGHGGGGHGGGYWRGGHFYYYPYGYGFWPGYWWWYDNYYYPYPYGGYGYRYYDRNDSGALDLDVSPGRTHVFVDGEDLGEVDRYDGWPSYLWLPRGTYDVALYLDGYKTISRQITIYPGTVIDIDDRMEQGNAVRPEDLATKTHERRDNRLRYERERRERIDRDYGDDDDDDWHDRVRQGDRGRRDDDDRGNVADRSSSHLRLSVEPEDSSVYLDGQFVGTGSDLSRMRAGIALSPGNHRLAVVRPGRRAVEKDFTVKDGEDVRLEISLESGSK